MKNFILTATMLCFGLISFQSTAADYPEKPIKLVVPYGPGGATDMAARALAITIPRYLEDQPIIVENKQGAGGQIARQFMAKAKPNGYTMYMSAIGADALGPALNPNLPIKNESFKYVAITQFDPVVLVVNAESNLKTFEDLVSELKANPGKLKYSSSGPGSSENVGAQILLEALGLGKKGAIEVPFNSGSKAIGALLGGHVDFVSQTAPNVRSHIQAGKLRALASATPDRLSYLPDVRTTTELGYPHYQIKAWRGIMGPADLPDQVVVAWQEAIEALASDKAWAKMVQNFGGVPFYIGPDEADSFVKSEKDQYRKMFSDLGILVK